MSERIRVYNKTKFSYGVVTPDGREFNIRTGSFALLTKDEIAYIESQSREGKKPFATGKLVVDKDKEEDVFENAAVIVNPDNVLVPDDEIEYKLKSNLATIRKWLNGIQDNAVLRTVGEVGKRMDLPGSKVKLLQEFIPGFEPEEQEE